MPLGTRVTGLTSPPELLCASPTAPRPPPASSQQSQAPRASQPVVGTGRLEPLPRLRGSSGGNQRGRGSPAGLSASPRPGSQRRGQPCCRGPWWAVLRALPPLCQNQQERQALFAPLPPKAPRATSLGLPPRGKQGERGPALLLVASVEQERGRGAAVGVPRVLPVCLVGGPSLKGTSVPCHIPPLPRASTQLSEHAGVGGQPPPRPS